MYSVSRSRSAPNPGCAIGCSAPPPTTPDPPSGCRTCARASIAGAAAASHTVCLALWCRAAAASASAGVGRMPRRIPIILPHTRRPFFARASSTSSSDPRRRCAQLPPPCACARAAEEEGCSARSSCGNDSGAKPNTVTQCPLDTLDSEEGAQPPLLSPHGSITPSALLPSPGVPAESPPNGLGANCPPSKPPSPPGACRCESPPSSIDIVGGSSAAACAARASACCCSLPMRPGEPPRCCAPAPASSAPTGKAEKGAKGESGGAPAPGPEKPYGPLAGRKREAGVADVSARGAAEGSSHDHASAAAPRSAAARGANGLGVAPPPPPPPFVPGWPSGAAPPAEKGAEP
mmetsp:Transcript_814/g.2223  ORF Transcript_814/g.2223 Transcript_814/m.2223 type:complete len:348 (+) Transcript_814:344-1387(+)